MYGFDVSNLISTLKVDEWWSSPFLMIQAAWCGPFYNIDLHVKYGTDSAPPPSVGDHLVLIQKGQVLHCDAMLIGAYWLEHPVNCTIKDDAGNEVFTKTKWLVAGIGQWTDFFRYVSLPTGYYSVDWSVCEGHGSHFLTVHDPGFETADIDMQIVVDSTAGINPYTVWDEIKAGVLAEMLVYNATVRLKYAEIDGEYLIIFHLEVTYPPEDAGSIGILPWIIYLALIAVIAALAIAVPALTNVWIAMIAYDTQFREFTYKDCAGMVWNDWAACMAGTYPDVWAEIKDKVEPPEPPPPPPEWWTYIMYIALAVGSMAGIFILVKYVLPALKGRR